MASKSWRRRPLGRYHHREPTIVVAQRLAYGIALIVVPAPWEREELRLEIREPCGALREKDQPDSNFEETTDNRVILSRSGLTARIPSTSPSNSWTSKVLRRRPRRARVLRRVGRQNAHSGLELGIVDPFPPDVDEIPSPVAANEPGRADRKVVLRSTFARGVPALENQRAFALQGQFHIPLDPMALDRAPLGGTGICWYWAENASLPS